MSTNTTYTVLLVDDDEFLIDMYSLKFTQAGHTVHAAFGAQEGINQLESGLQPDAIVFDIVMPHMDGFALLEAIKERGLAQDAALIVLSNQGEKEDLDRAKELGAIGHIVKANAIPSEVVTMVIELIQNHKGKTTATDTNAPVGMKN